MKKEFGELFLLPLKNGLNRPSRDRGIGFKMVNMGEIFAHNRIYDIDMELVLLSEKEKQNYNLLKNDLLFARQSIVAEGAGKCSIVREVSSTITCFESHIIRVRLNEKLASPLYFYYFFQSDLGKGYLSAIRQQGVQAGIRGSDLSKLKLPYFPLTTQRKIASILSGYDDLIENNLKRIKLLEEKAQLTYEEWFVKMRFPGYETAKLDEVTGLPEGWEEIDLNNYISIKHGYAFKGEFFSETVTNKVLLTPGNFRIGGGVKLDKLKFYNDEAECPYQYILEPFDLLITMTDLSKQGDTLGYPLLVPSSNDKIFLHNQRLGKVIPKQETCFPKYFLRFYFQDFIYRSFVVGSSTGSTVKHTSPTKILFFKPKLPSLDSKLIFQFDKFAKPIMELIDKLYLQNDKFKEARDILLPRLMSGMIDVDEVQMETLQTT